MSRMRLALFAVLLSLAGCEAGAAPADGARAKQLVAEGATLLDVRTPGEFGGSHLPGAKNIPVDELEARVAELDKARPVVTYCAAGVRSARAASLLRTQGFAVHDLGTASAWPSN
jgi:phage shock protein E